MHTHKESFASPLTPEQVLDRFRQLSEAKGWALTWGDDGRLHAQSGPTLRAAGEDMEVSADPWPEGTLVHVVVKSRFGKWQVIDWGEASKFHREIVECLNRPQVSGD